ncbi:hypothetical protein HMH01_00940 [Halovulum dunhuangense]|uniref:Universal stress protein family protein n=1 Tax=Halovulum dunhuangense TaxID=1505036 RepID=A0A849KTW6_9RHOB|nr:hypothetical protein [Halovulum dunhuangense]NNU78991.1 hypothetical protein [Halovulum dunhuangense]
MSGQPRRITLGATRFDDARASLDLALGLAAEARAMLRGLLIEEEGILAFAARSGARALGPGGQPVPEVTAERMRAAFRADAARFRRLIEQMAGQRGLDWSFAQERGRLAALATAQGGPDDLLILSGEASRSRPAQVVLLVRDGSDPGLAGLTAEAARILAAGRPVRVLALRGSDLTALPPGARVEQAETEAALGAQIARLGTGAVLVADRGALSGPVRVALLAARCTRLLRAAQPGTTG